MDVTLTEDRRQLADWLAQGRFALAIFPGTNEIDEAAKQGLPVGYADVRKFKEGFPVSAAFGSVALLNRRPIRTPRSSTSTGCCRRRARSPGRTPRGAAHSVSTCRRTASTP